MSFAPGRWRLSTRLVVLSLLLLLIVQLLSLAAVRASVQRNARLQLTEQLEVGTRIWTRLLEQRAAKLGQGAGVLAADFGFRSAVGSDDRETIVSALENHGGRIGAAVAALLDTRFALMAAHPNDAGMARALAPIAPTLAKGGSVVAMVGTRPMQFVMVPLRSPLLVGWVVMGFDLDRSLVVDMNAVTDLHATLVLKRPGTAGAAQLLHTSLPETSPARALALGQLSEAELPWVQRELPVSSSSEGVVGLHLAGPLEQAMEPYEGLLTVLLLLTGAGLLLFALGNIWSARRVTQPLRSLAEASERLGRGDYASPVQHQGRGDEIGNLARAFEHMRVNIAANEREIRQLAYWDRLTGLPNREQFRDAVGALLGGSGTAPQSLAVVMLDLDRFKHVNDVLGYASGDRLLRGVAERLQQLAPSGEAAGNAAPLIARLGGDEFALLLPGADATAAMAMATRIATVFEAPLSLDDQAVDLSAAVGIACWPPAEATPTAGSADLLLSRAEVAMYAAKRRTSGAVLFESSLDSGSAQTLSLLGELRHAVEHDELRLFLQPKVAIATGELCGAEALVRWQHPLRGLVPPMQFIPFAEQTGFVRQLTLWIFEAVARQLAAAQALGVQRISVNLSTRDLMDQDLPEKLATLLQRHGARPQGLCLEITESAIMDDPQRAQTTIDRLAAQGFKLSIDDFGTGYSSLAYLRQLPVNELKIDKSFVMGMAKAEGDEKIVRSTVDLAHNLGLSVVAEGVEDADILARLAALGCDEAQGYHLSRPLPWDGFATWAAKWNAQRGADAGRATNASPQS